MEIDLSSSQEFYLKKRLFNLKTHRSDGLILQVHHSYSDAGGDNKKFRFIFASFSSSGNSLAVSDHRGHVFNINLESQKYWQLPQVGLPTLISFPTSKNRELLIGLDNTSVVLVDVETGNTKGVLSGHSLPATDVSYSDDGFYYLTSCSAEAIVWDSSTFTQIHKLTLKSNIYLKKVLFIPVTSHILACFQDDTMHIWKFGSFECIKQIIPETWKTHHLNSIAITKNGRTMVIGGQSSNLVTFCLDSWHIKHVLEFPDKISGVKQLEFLSEVFDGGSNRILVVLTTLQELFFFDTESLFTLKWINQVNGLAAKFSLSCTGNYLAITLTTGEVNIYTVDKMLGGKNWTIDAEGNCTLNPQPTWRVQSSSSRRSQRTNESLNNIQKEIKDTLDIKKLLPILKQFGEYPQSYRLLIWKTILKLPENQECFYSLSIKKCHPSYNKIDLKYPLANKSLCNSLKKVLSNLSHWCPLFGEVDFLPEFVFPFVKLFHSSPIICFEVVASVIVNWCQNWFEFYPFPPINLLSVLESILGYHDPDLLEFYIANNITSSVSVCPLFHTAFSEVLSKTEWLKLWDHILSNEPSFLFMAIIAYNVVCRNTIKSLRDTSEIEKYFRSQDPVDLKMLINKAYQYLRETPDDIHTRQFFAPFCPLGSGGSYISFLAYPKLIFDSSVEKLQTIRREEEKILDEQFKALSIKKALEEKLHQDSNVEEKKKIYRDLEEKIRKAVEEEEDRLLTERQKLQNLRQELKLKELEVLENTRDKFLKEKIKQKRMEYDRLMKDISKRKHREKIELGNMETEIRNYYSDLLLRKSQLEMELGVHDYEHDVNDNLEKQREMLKNDLTDLQYGWDSCYHSKRIDICNKIAAIKGLICDVEADIAKEVEEKKWESQLKGDRTFVGELKEKVRSLENEIEGLIRTNLNNLKTKVIPSDSRPPTKVELLRKSEKKDDGRYEETARLKKKEKHVTEKCSPRSGSNSGRITTHNSKLLKTKPKDSFSDKEFSDVPQEGCHGFLNTDTSNSGPARLKSPQKRSRYTQSNELRRPDNSETFSESNGPKNRGMKNCQPEGDFSRDKNISTFPKYLKNENLSNFKIKEGDPLIADEIFKSTLRVRSEIIEEAKRRQGIS